MVKNTRKEMKLLEADIRHKKLTCSEFEMIAKYLRFLGAKVVEDIMKQPESEQANLRGQLIVVQNLLDLVDHSGDSSLVPTPY